MKRVIFASELGQQLDVVYLTSDNKPFVRYMEAVNHANGNYENEPLKDKTIRELFNDIDENADLISRNLIIQKIEEQESKLHDMDCEGHIWWNKFKKFIKEIKK